MDSFDPDEEIPFIEPSEDDAVQLRHNRVTVDSQAALELLDKVTHDLPGGGETRESQRLMVKTIAESFSNNEYCVIEAGTGVGKSLGYLIPAALSGARVVVATATKNLQSQLAAKDAPLVAEHLRGVKVAILKGKQNYLCLNRTTNIGGGQLTFDDGSKIPQTSTDQIREIVSWSRTTETGDLDELHFEVDEKAKRAVTVTPQECLSKNKCPQGGNCFHEIAKAKAAEASIVVVNTALYAADLATGRQMLPKHDFVIFDEAHETLDIFARALGTSLAAASFRAAATIARLVLEGDAAKQCLELQTVAERFNVALDDQFASGKLTGVSEKVQLELVNLTTLVTQITEALKAIKTENADALAKVQRATGPLVHLLNDLIRVRSVKSGELLFLVKGEREVKLEISLIEVGDRLAEELWSEVSAVLTSATIPLNLPRDLGLPKSVEVQRLPSPFNYEEHGLLYVPDGFPDRRDDEAAIKAIIEELVTLIAAAGGRTLALFTNRTVMQRVAAAVAPRIDTEVLVQYTKSRQRIIEEFRQSPEASLFAVTSFWQGIDVPGHSLSLVTIDRLPFSVPGEPLAEARRERSENPFMEVDLPKATMLLAQGVGRLIRTATDKGVVAVFDTRLAESRYRGKMFKALPPMKRTRDRAEVIEFLKTL